MAKILIESDTRPMFARFAPLVIEVKTNDDDGAYGDCPQCRERISDRGHFEDTVKAISIHVDKGSCS